MNIQYFKEIISVIFLLPFLFSTSHAQVITHELSHSLAFPSDVIDCDVNQDGLTDIVACSSKDNRIVWFEQFSDGTFSSPKYISEHAAGVLIIRNIDINLDGKEDIISLNSGENKVTLYLNQGGGSFATGITLINNAIHARSLNIEDINGDGKKDIILFSSDLNKISYYANINGNFSSEMILISGVEQLSTYSIADYDGDGDYDLFYGFNNGSISMLVNSGNGTFSIPQQIINETGVITQIQFTDLNNDSLLDIVYTYTYALYYQYYKYSLGNPSGEFGIINDLFSNNTGSGNHFTFLDLDNDSYKDIILYSDSFGPLKWRKNNAGNSFGSEMSFSGISSYSKNKVIDIDNDGYYDIIGVDPYSTTIGYLRNNGQNGFQNTYLSPEVNRPNSIHMQDITGDGFLDILYSTSKTDQIGYFSNDGAGNFLSSQLLYQGNGNAPIKNVRAADIDGDGNVDILGLRDALNTFNDTVFWIKNNGAGGWNSPVSIGFSVNFGSNHFECLDVDLDGDMDIISYLSPSFGMNSKQLVWYENNGSGGFGHYSLLAAISDIADFKVVDLDLDGDQDIVYISTGNYRVSWLENLGNGTFNSDQPLKIIGGNKYLTNLFIKDVNGDEQLDLLLVISQNEIVWFPNLGGNSFGDKQIIAPISNAFGTIMTPIDFDNDGYLDVVYLENINNMTVPRLLLVRNLGGGVFDTEPIILQYGRGNVINSSFLTEDIDLDGDIDIISMGNNENSSIWYLENVWNRSTLVSGVVFIDENQNQIYDSGEFPFPDVKIITSPNAGNTFSTNQGEYMIGLLNNSTNYTVSAELPYNWGLTTDSTGYFIEANTTHTSVGNKNFGFYPTAIIDSIDIDLTAGIARCNTQTNYWLNIKNTGTTMPRGIIDLELPEEITFEFSEPIPDSIKNSHIYWSYDNFRYFSDTTIKCVVKMPDFNSMGNIFQSVLHAIVIGDDSSIRYSTSDTLSQVLLCAYDPNDKISKPAGYGKEGFISMETSMMDYTIRFQNTGNDTAMIVVIKDQLDENLNWQTLVPVSASHSFTTHVSETGEVVFTFDNIMLPDSSANFIKSQGFVKYRIRLNDNLTYGTKLTNTAEIYFDYNPPVITNTVVNTLYDCNNVWDNFSLTDTLTLCQGSILSINGDAGFTSYSSGSLNQYFGESINWVADTSGLINMTLNASNSFCSVDTSLTINVLGQSRTNLGIINLCEGDSVQLHGVFQTTSGIYYNTLQAVNGCDSILYYQLIINLNPIVQIDSIPTFFCIGDESVILQGIPSGGFYTGSGIIDNVFNPLHAGLGEHVVVYNYTDSYNCSGSDSLTLFVDGCLNIANVDGLTYKVIPNPFNETCEISFDTDLDGTYRVQLIDLLGNLLHDYKYPIGNTIVVNEVNLSRGSYYMIIQGDITKVISLIKL